MTWLTKWPSILALGTALALCDCSRTQPIEGNACPDIAAAGPTLIAPAPGSLAVPSTVGSLTVTNAFSTETITLATAAGIQISTSSLASIGAGQFVETFGALPAHTSFVVTASGIPEGCGSYTTAIGTFTTQ